MTALAFDLYREDTLSGWETNSFDDGIDLEKEGLKVPSVVQVPLNTFYIGQQVFSVAKPLELVIRDENEGVIVCCETLSIYASGSDVSDAIRDFKEQFEYFYRFYKAKNVKDLSGEAVRLKEIYETQVFENPHLA